MRHALLAFLTLWLSPQCRALYMQIDIEKVPIERILENLQSKLKLQPDSFDLHYQLARVHAMAAYSEATELPVYKSGQYHIGRVKYSEGGGDNGTPIEWGFKNDRGQRPKGSDIGKNPNPLLVFNETLKHYEAALLLMRKSSDIDNIRGHVQPVQLGFAWCLEKAGLRTQALDLYRQTFYASWQIEISHDFDVQGWKSGKILELSDLKPIDEPAAEKRGQIFRSIGPGICFSEESVNYMLRLLDKQKDATEIGVLNYHKKHLSTMGRKITPILIPLGDTPFEALVAPDAGVAFDLDGSGLTRHWGWITPKAAWLVFDGKQTGQITSGLQMFGSVTFWIFWRDGYQALGSLDANGDGLLNGTELNGLALWQDINGNGISEPGEVKPIATYGIDQLSCRGEAADPGLRLSRQGVRFKDGSFRPTYDWDSPMCAPAAVK
jgi:hypothetical protein